MDLGKFLAVDRVMSHSHLSSLVSYQDCARAWNKRPTLSYRPHLTSWESSLSYLLKYVVALPQVGPSLQSRIFKALHLIWISLT